MRLDKIYTKVGDKGTTLLASGQKVSKASLRIHSYGEVDELNAQLGLWRDLVVEHGRAFPREAAGWLGSLPALLLKIQHELFDLGAELATPLAQIKAERQKLIDARTITRLEAEIDAFNEELPPLANFVLPGGHVLNSQAHVARCVCRRAERAVVALAEAEELRAEARIYLNRLSDWLFVAGRRVSLALACAEVLWQQDVPASV